ncbi:MAG: hypothetical protein IPL28_21560 [Chloroflexi bacterium]|nr:hypothetical protein [Chloroflexota bacterium]
MEIELPYIRQSDTPLWPTISPEVEGGEALIPRYDLEMWLWEDGFSYSLGTIKQCWLKDAFWSNNEQKSCFGGIRSIPSCLDTFTSPQAWLFNLDNRTSHPLFLQPEYPAVQVWVLIRWSIFVAKVSLTKLERIYFFWMLMG